MSQIVKSIFQEPTNKTPIKKEDSDNKYIPQVRSKNRKPIKSIFDTYRRGRVGILNPGALAGGKPKVIENGNKIK